MVLRKGTVVTVRAAWGMVAPRVAWWGSAWCMIFFILIKKRSVPAVDPGKMERWMARRRLHSGASELKLQGEVNAG